MSVRILIVDDEPHIRTVMRLTLEGRGYEVGEASSGEEALERFAEDGARWDLVLLDERMPGIDGLETLQRLRQQAPDVVIIMVTAFASIELAVEAMKLGATDFVRKPMTPETLRAAVDGALVKARGEWPPAAAAAAAQPTGEHRYEVWMMNGFRVKHVSAGASSAEQRFQVTRGSEPARTVVVEFAPTVVAAASEEGRRPLDRDDGFWVRQAALVVTQHVWSHADVPPDGRIVVTTLTERLLTAARRTAR